MDTQIKNKLNTVDNYDALLNIAYEYLEKDSSQKKVGFISHTIFSFGGVQDNLLKIEKLIEAYNSEEYFIFNQIPFLDIHLPMINNIKGETKNKFEYFFKPLFENKIHVVYFDKESLKKSKGTQQEYEYAKKFGLKIVII